MFDQVMLDPSLTLPHKGLYALLCALTRGGTPITFAELVERSGCSRKTLRLYLAPLEAGGLVAISRSEQDHRVQLIRVTNLNEERCEAMINQITRRLGQARRRMREEGSKESVGETLMKEWLNLLVADQTFTDNARPGFLTNPLTGERLEYDRWYLGLKLAWEFHGPQHFQTGKHQPDPEQLARQQTNDLVKIGLSQREGITLIEVQAKDLRLDRMVALIPPGVPVRSLQGLEPVVGFLEEESSGYRFQAGLSR